MQIFKTMVKEEGLFRPMRGMSAMVAGAGPAHAMYFGSLEMGKHLTAKYNMPSTVGDGKTKNESYIIMLKHPC